MDIISQGFFNILRSWNCLKKFEVRDKITILYLLYICLWISTYSQVEEHSTFNTEKEEDHSDTYEGMDYLEDEDGELTWFNAGVRVGVAIGLSVCLGVGIGVGLLVRTYQGATCNFRRRLL